MKQISPLNRERSPTVSAHRLALGAEQLQVDVAEGWEEARRDLEGVLGRRVDPIPVLGLEEQPGVGPRLDWLGLRARVVRLRAKVRKVDLRVAARATEFVAREAGDRRRRRRVFQRRSRIPQFIGPGGVHGRADVPRVGIDGVCLKEALRDLSILVNRARDLLRLCSLDRRVSRCETGATAAPGVPRPHARRRLS